MPVTTVASVTPALPTARRIRLLVVDDHEVVRQGLVALLDRGPVRRLQPAARAVEVALILEPCAERSADPVRNVRRGRHALELERPLDRVHGQAAPRAELALDVRSKRLREDRRVGIDQLLQEVEGFARVLPREPEIVPGHERKRGVDPGQQLRVAARFCERLLAASDSL